VTTLPPLIVGNREIPVDRCGVLVIGSGAASLAAADRLAALASVSNGPTIADDTVIVTESLQGGTSRNAGSDKQTYYRLALAEREGDSAYDMARAIWDGGAVHGDIALAEAVGSLEAFYHLVSIGVPFPMNSSGGFVGYKTDHDPRRRGTSIGPYTSKVMVERLLQDVNRWGIPVLEGLHAVALVAAPPSLDERGIQIASGRVFGARLCGSIPVGRTVLWLALYSRRRGGIRCWWSWGPLRFLGVSPRTLWSYRFGPRGGSPLRKLDGKPVRVILPRFPVERVRHLPAGCSAFTYRWDPTGMRKNFLAPTFQVPGLGIRRCF